VTDVYEPLQIDTLDVRFLVRQFMFYNITKIAREHAVFKFYLNRRN